MRCIVVCSLCVLVLAPAGWAQGRNPGALVATLSANSQFVQTGRPIWVDFTVTNTSDEPVELIVPGTEPVPSDGVVGLPLTHVFSGKGFAGLTVRGSLGQAWDVVQGYHPPASAETLVLGPHASIGKELDVTRYYRVLRNPGRFIVRWEPYGGMLSSNELIIEVDTLKQALIQTDHGSMTVRFLYEEAPNHVANFIELTRQGFYDNLTFHRILPGYCVQGGCPHGDGTGIRPDGVKLRAELSDRPVERGTVCMARLEDDPDSASCQFLMANTRIPQWDRKYTVFGELADEESLATLEKLIGVPTKTDGSPKQRLYIRTVRITDVPTEAENRWR
ncbi:MAG TPA: peptidylprolyl isomerase [Phycisphaerae bacterium]|nr:peptidylprolyl isomerase [Phycisphaerae bacterium]